MITLRATFTNGDRESTVEASTVEEARGLMQTEMLRRFGGDAEIEYFEDRGLVWSCEEDSIDDDGARAVASIYESDVSPRETALLLALASACKAAGLLDAELPPSEMVRQAQILLDAMDSQALSVTLDDSAEG